MLLSHNNNTNNRGGRGLWQVIDMSMALMVMTVSLVRTYPQTHQVGDIKYTQLFTCQSSLNKVVFKKISQ